MTQANTDDTLQRIQTEEAPRLAAHLDAIHLNDSLFRRVRSVYERRADLGLDSVQTFLAERYYRDFVRAGALLAEPDKVRLRALNQEESKLATDFQNRLLAATKSGAVVVGDKNELDGLSDADIAAAAEAARQRKLDGKWVLPLQNTTQQPAQASLKNRAVRQRLFIASTTRAERGDSNDTREIVRRLAQLRAQRAQLLGYPSLAAYVLDDQMAKTPDAAIKLLSDLVPAATAQARREAEKLQAMINKQRGGFKLAPWDWQYYAEQVRKAEYALDESQLMPYLELDRVLKDGVFFAANRLYGLSFKQRTDLPVYHPDVRVFEMFDADGLRRVSLAVQRALGARAHRVGPLCQAPQNRPAYAAHAGGQDQASPYVRPGIRHHRVRGCGAARHGMAQPAGGSAASGYRRLRVPGAQAVRRGCARGAAALPHDLFLSHMERRGLRRLLRVLVVRGAR